jgi:glycosyltransferase involved in cell wall biosynthesis
MAGLAIKGRGVPSHMIDIVHLGIDTSVFQPHASTYVYEVVGVASDKKIVVYAGHMEPRKGVRTLVEAAIELFTAAA